MTFSIKKISVIFIFCCIVLGAVHAHAQSWLTVGSPGFSAGQTQYTSIAIDGSGTPYIVYVDDTNSEGATVMKYDGSSWVTVGSPNISGGPVTYTAIAIDASGTPYVVYAASWCGIGICGPVSVMKYNGSSWVSVGSPSFSAGDASWTSIAIDTGGTPYVAYADSANGNKATVMKFNGTSWVVVGSPGFSVNSVYSTYLAIDASGTPYVVYADDTIIVGSTAGEGPVSVMKFNGTSWVNVGSPGFSAGQGYYTTMAIDGSGTPYVAYEDGANGNKATVMKYSGTNWENVGSAGFSAGDAQYTSIAIDGSGTPYVVYLDGGNGSKTTVSKYNGSSWLTVGTPGMSLSWVGYTTIAMDGSGTPYIAYGDFGYFHRSVVMKLDTSSGVKNIIDPAISLNIFPDPNHGSFTLNISSAQKENATVMITNILGEQVKEITVSTNVNNDVALNVAAGMYFVSAVVNGEKIMQKIVVE